MRVNPNNDVLTAKSSIPRRGLKAFLFSGEKKLAAVEAEVCLLGSEEVCEMAANSQQGTYLATTLTGFTALAGGLVAKGTIGILAALVGLILLIVSAAGFHKIKDLG